MITIIHSIQHFPALHVSGILEAVGVGNRVRRTAGGESDVVGPFAHVPAAAVALHADCVCGMTGQIGDGGRSLIGGGGVLPCVHHPFATFHHDVVNTNGVIRRGTT